MKKWHKWLIFVICFLALMGGAVYFWSFVLAAQNGSQKEEIVLRLAETMPEEHPSAQASRYFAHLVEEKTGGKIKIVVYYNCELGDEVEVLEQVQFGGIALARVNMTALAGVVPRLESYMRPYSFETPQGILDALFEDREVNEQALQREKLELLCWYAPDKRCFYNDQHEIRQVEDFEGMKLRTPSSRPIMASVVALGALPRVIAAGNYFDSMQNRYIDGVETTLMEYYLDDYAAISKYLTTSDYIYAPDAVLASSVTFSRIPLDVQKVIRECARETVGFQREQLISRQRECIEKFINRGGALVESVEFDRETRPYLINKYEENDNGQ